MRWRDGGLALLLFCPGVASAGLFPDMAITYNWSGTQVFEGSSHDFRIGPPSGYGIYVWPGGAANGVLFRGNIGEGATQVSAHFLGSTGFKVETSGEYFPAAGDYFMVVYRLPPWADSSWHHRVFEWFRNGTSILPSAIPPESWGIIRFRVGPELVPPTVSELGQFRKLGVTPIGDGATFVGNEAVFRATISDTDSVSVRLEVEVKPNSSAFDGAGVVSATSTPGSVSVVVPELIPPSQHYVSGGNTASFHWRARAVDAEGNASDWIEYGGDTSAADFSVKVVPLWTQIESEYPSRPASALWSVRPYGSGYDTDCSVADPTNATIGKCGCAISSAIMIASYYGLTHGIDGSGISPLELNRWLTEHGGYVGMNNVNWAKVEEYLGIVLDEAPHKRLALDYANFKTRSRAVVGTALSDNVPVIAFSAEAGHYFVLDSALTSSEGDTYTVRDPRWYNTRTLEDEQDLPNEVRGYANEFTHGTIFRELTAPQRIAAHVELYLASPAELLVTDSAGRRAGRDPRTGIEYAEIPGARYLLEDRIVTSDASIGSDVPHPPKVLWLPEFNYGDYVIEVIGTGDGAYTLTAVMTDASASTSQRHETDVTSADEVSTYRLSVSGDGASELEPTVAEYVSRLRKIIGDDLPNLRAQLTVLEEMRARGTGDTDRLIDAMLREISMLMNRGALSAEAADTITAILYSLRPSL